MPFKGRGSGNYASPCSSESFIIIIIIIIFIIIIIVTNIVIIINSANIWNWRTVQRHVTDNQYSKQVIMNWKWRKADIL